MQSILGLLGSPRKPAAPAATAPIVDDSPIATSSQTENRTGRVQKSSTPKKGNMTSLRGKQRTERLAEHVRNSSPLQEIINDRSESSRRQSAPVKPAGTPREKANIRRGRRSAVAQLGTLADEDEAQDSPIEFASQPITVSALSPVIDRESQLSSLDSQDMVRDSQQQDTSIDVHSQAVSASPAPDANMAEENPDIDVEELGTVARDLVENSEEMADEDNADVEAEAAEADVDTDMDDNEGHFTFTKLLAHRWVGNEIEIKVDWHGSDSTWEPETYLHRDAPDALFAYWRSQGGRPENPRDAGLYDIFAIRDHKKNKQRLLVEWTGYPPEESTWELRKVIEKTAPETVAEYWETVKPSTKSASKRKQKK